MYLRTSDSTCKDYRQHLPTLPPCAVPGCPNQADPRWYIVGPDGVSVMVCDGHEVFPENTTDVTTPNGPASIEGSP